MTRLLCLKIADWPTIDRQIWLNARSASHFDKRARIARRLGERRCRILCQAYGQWLSWMDHVGVLDPVEAPERRATPHRLERFTLQLQQRVAPQSCWMMIQGLQSMLKVMAPDHDWAWLAVLVANLKRAATSTRDKRPHMVDPHALYELGISLMTDARSWALNGNYHAATVGRDGLIIALLICCPVRIANLTAIEIGNHLVAADDGYVLTFRSEETKNGDEINLELPPAMTSWIDFYLRVHRKALLARGDGRETRSLWINRWGTPASEHVIRDQIEKRTSDAFGRHVWPHLFRAIAGTGFVDHAPAQMALLPDLLGHRTVQTSHRYYVLSNGMMAHTAVQSTVAQRRSAARARRDLARKEKR